MKKSIQGVIAYTAKTFNKKVLVGFLGYRDLCDKDKRFETFYFTTEVEKMVEFLFKITATGGGDSAEDVIGALEKSLNEF